MADSQPNSSMASSGQPHTGSEAIVIGLYGIPGSGKSHLLSQLQQELGEDLFSFYEGSVQIAKLVPGGLSAFQRLSEPEKTTWRQQAIDTIAKENADNGKVAVVAGHLMFWSEEDSAPVSVYTQHDSRTFKHILYLDVHAQEIAKRRQNDKEKGRESQSADHLHKWQLVEKDTLRDLCQQHGILFSVVSESLPKTLLSKSLRTGTGRTYSQRGTQPLLRKESSLLHSCTYSG